jgi:uncharacterized membrane protein
VKEHGHLHTTFGGDAFGQLAERLARFFGTPGYIVGQTIVVIAWIIANGLFLTGVWKWDPYPFILLNLAFSTQAAYAAPLILLAATRQAARDKINEGAASRHRDEIATAQAQLLEENTRLTSEVHRLTEEIHRKL